MSKEKARFVIKIKRLDPAAQIPRYEYLSDSGTDIYAVADCTLQPFERKAIPTGLCAEVLSGFELQIRPRSGLSLESGITVLNTPGTIDSGYRGEIKVILINLSSEKYQIKKGQKIAQLVVAPVIHANFKEVEELSESERGTRGFGSTDVV
ncbi:MAG: dUTP diphosphatase [Methanocellales archaeon]|nr:dUTP diphosphatase [Methanocellales archaeon]MDD3291090.1 dUTP diphosphatase [Methanocellales archaeon]MDD5234975.1 dUTP diphosphatase [Methanocellales archaeon]MDD5484654.1 dUTP diphosphatase [Methanocellales archaeon]